MRHWIRRPFIYVLNLTWLLAVCAAASWFWLNWPEWTANDFVETIRAGAFDQANDFMASGDVWRRDRNWTLVIESTGPYSTHGFLIPAAKIKSAAPLEDWILLQTAIDRGQANDAPDTVPGFLLPAEQWQAWFQSPYVHRVPRTVSDYFHGIQRVQTLGGKCVFEARIGNISVITGPSNFRDFLRTRFGQLIVFSGGAIAEIEYGADTAKKIAFFGPRQADTNSLPAFLSNEQSERLYRTTATSKRVGQID